MLRYFLGKEPEFEKLKCLLLKSYSWLLAIVGHKYRCPDPPVRHPMLFLIKVWIQSVGTNSMFLKKRKTWIIYHFL